MQISPMFMLHCFVPEGYIVHKQLYDKNDNLVVDVSIDNYSKINDIINTPELLDKYKPIRIGWNIQPKM